MATYAAKTEVTSDRSRGEIERTLSRYGATHFGYMSEPGRAIVAFQKDGRQIRFVINLPERTDREFTHHSRGLRTAAAADAAWESATRQRWRALALVVKAKLEAVESGIAEFDQEFLGYMVLPSGRTVFEEAAPQVNAMLESGTPTRLMLTA